MNGNERWLPIPGYEGVYEASDMGRVKRVGRAKGARVGRILKMTPDRKGYLRVDLYKHNIRRIIPIHYLVAITFIGPRPDGHEANHVNTNKQDNRPSNLEWITRLKNRHHAMAHGLHSPPPIRYGENANSAKLTNDDVRQIRALLAEGKLSYRQIGNRFGVCKETVARIKRGKAWKNQ